MTEMSPENVSGYVTGEGCFYAESGYDSKYKLKHRIRLAFCIEVRVDDRILLDMVKKQLGCGNVYSLDFGRYKGYEAKNWRPHVKLRISNFEDLFNKVIPFFKQHNLFGVKKQAFDIFYEIAEAIKNKKHLEEKGLEEIKALVKQLHELNKKGL
ncbi:MAG: hypothetical protein COW11_03010 [Candidatus Omnitrophica bacterium CG12_big_fil_rev_8_21_14_0_65_43_15]|uniref:Homing endonuclease LAGLIDADG domain-containing protein n=1 Tax=Candidatus Taenaricola geysiri TaxID=1974752 RepID=A0A2J0LF82_9BACT|nr:MAG: hypothetical protein COW11_03010 [Candidatus Omnitrophica bacterium CG12_big_fil_rev_8_21_14_0_65_43_15]PIW79973.1 MAG: hypothetical protein COZ98_04660 [Candidatus Omnitrophica bacterium CG_4_8_14_3_um_filter_43_15]PIY84787.1 MAG: hypothetical protein COY77_00580 [Candidatus Omnitrophica bacterium CG_4_10_14_0_8_um_filter_43_18]PJC46739.1 MAG: hypothetical protein CO036_01225 [Candidatus Omnitrophica bacterium CG_4_9_14_0_2_um_filter_43_12]